MRRRGVPQILRSPDVSSSSRTPPSLPLILLLFHFTIRFLCPAPPSAPQCPPLPPAVPMSAYERSLCRFVDAGRSGRRNALPDIMAASSSVGTAGLSEQLAHALTLLGPGTLSHHGVGARGTRAPQQPAQAGECTRTYTTGARANSAKSAH
ncbi:unnamed protein product [Lampetra fluviatilis]